MTQFLNISTRKPGAEQHPKLSAGDNFSGLSTRKDWTIIHVIYVKRVLPRVMKFELSAIDLNSHSWQVGFISKPKKLSWEESKDCWPPLGYISLILESFGAQGTQLGPILITYLGWAFQFLLQAYRPYLSSSVTLHRAFIPSRLGEGVPYPSPPFLIQSLRLVHQITAIQIEQYPNQCFPLSTGQ